LLRETRSLKLVMNAMDHSTIETTLGMRTSSMRKSSPAWMQWAKRAGGAEKAPGTQFEQSRDFWHQSGDF
jgi:hypothetical protein